MLREYAYMNTGWSGPLSTPVGEAMRRRGGQRGSQSLSRAKHAFSRCGFLYPGIPTPLHPDRDLDTHVPPWRELGKAFAARNLA